VVSGHHAFQQKAPQKVNQALVLQTYRQGQYVGDLLLTFNKNFEIVLSEDLSRPLDKSVPEDSDFVALVKKYRDQISQHRDRERQKWSETGNARPGYFIGAVACQKCHPQPYQQWQATRHARAFKSLQKSEASNNQQCLPCHTTGYQITNGFRNIQTTPQLANVQCEQCHGTRFKHVRSRGDISTPPVRFASKIEDNTDEDLIRREIYCRKCHSKERDPDFDFEMALAKIKHE